MPQVKAEVKAYMYDFHTQKCQSRNFPFHYFIAFWFQSFLSIDKFHTYFAKRENIDNKYLNSKYGDDTDYTVHRISQALLHYDTHQHRPDLIHIIIKRLWHWHYTIYTICFACNSKTI